MLSRYEVSRVVGLRALQLAGGARSTIVVPDAGLSRDFLYVATLELQKVLPARCRYENMGKC